MLYSIFIYAMLYTVIILITYIGEKLLPKNKKIGIFFLIIAILILSIFAGLRSYSVGTDINVYGLRIYNSCLQFGSLGNYLTTIKAEHLYYILNFFVSRFSGDFHVCLFVIQFILSVLLYRFAYDNKERINITFFIFSYLLLFHNTTFNILRQSISILIILNSYKHLEKERYIKYFIGILIAFLFHCSSLFALIFAVIKYLSKTKRSMFNSVVLFVLFILSFYLLKTGIISIPFLADKYESYLFEYALSFSWFMFIIKSSLLLILIMYSKIILSKKENHLVFILSIFDIFCYLLSSIIRYGYRLSYFTFPFVIASIAIIDKGVKGESARLLYRILIITIMIAYWIFRYCIIGYDGVIPFKFSF